MLLKLSDSSMGCVCSGNLDVKSLFTSASSYSICFSSLWISFHLHTSARCFCRHALHSLRLSPASILSDVSRVTPPSSSSTAGRFLALAFAAHFMALGGIVPTKAIVFGERSEC